MSTRRFVQFAIGEHVMEFPVSWSSNELGAAIEDVMRGDGFLWVPIDVESDDGVFVNIGRCSFISLVDRQVLEEG